MHALTRLPVPDNFGNFWLGKKPRSAVIFRSGSSKHPVRPEKWFASSGCDADWVIFEGPGIRYFDSPFEALQALAGEALS